MQLHQLQRKTKNKSEKRVGRGGSRGKTAGRGTKGQKARAGHKIYPQVREQIKKLPKQRGYRFKSIQEKPFALNVGKLGTLFTSGDTVNPMILADKKIIHPSQKVKVLGDGELTKKLTISGCAVSASARTKIEKAGGTIV
jgi:large subunit ribosomal protein L15